MRKLFFLFLALVATASLWAYDFKSGDLYYNIISDTTVAVTYQTTFNLLFPNYSSLTTISIPETISYDGITYLVTSIGDSAFFNCDALTSVTIPNSVTNIGEDVFSGCSLTNPVYNANCFVYMPTSYKGTYAIPNGIKQIASSAFSSCYYLTSITIPNSVTSIGNYAFSSCFDLTSITIPNSVTSIGNRAFRYCSSLTSITCLGTTPPTLGTGVFYDTKLSAVYIPDNTLSAYQTAWGAEYAYVNNENTLTLHVATPGTLEDLIFDAGTRPALVAKLTLTGTLNDDDFTCMRETMTSLVDLDLSGITNTSGVNLNGKARLVRIILPTNLTSIGAEAFNGCSSLTSITIPNSVTSIGNYAFSDCSSLTSITIPNSVTSIGKWAFRYCSSLTSVTIGNSVESIGSSAFYGCSRLTSVTIPNSVTSIGDDAFAFCRSLTSVTIGNSVESIGSSAFNGCSSLTSITIGNSVTSIGNYAFAYCSSLTSIICLGTTPPDASDPGANTSTCKLIVPHSAYNAYLRHAYWGAFLNIHTGYLVTLQANNDQWGEVSGTNLYTKDTTITITATPYEGYTFMRWSDGNTDNPRTLTITQDTTLTADFAIEGGCLVTFVDCDGTVLSSVSVAPGEAATAPADPTREGYTFIGWDKDFSAVTDHMTVTAQYQINHYQVRFLDYDGTELQTDSVEYQSAATAPSNPYRQGHTFIGWDKDFTSITSDLDIYAQYEMGEDYDMTIVFTNSEDNNSEIYSQSLTIKVPAAPEIVGFTFLYWQPVAEPLTDTITIQAIYKADTLTSAPEVYVNPANPAQKLLRNGHVYILRDGNTYTIQGQKL